MEGDDEPTTHSLSHSLQHADMQALNIGGYFDRCFTAGSGGMTPGSLAKQLRGVTLVGSNPAFDAAMLTRYIGAPRSEEHTSELQSLMRISYAVFCLKQKKQALTTVTKT